METETHATRHEASCSCCERTLWIWRLGEQVWVDSPPVGTRPKPHWMPPEPGEAVPAWVLQARETANASPEEGAGEDIDEQNELIDEPEEPEEPLVFCPRCMAAFQKGMASGKAVFNRQNGFHEAGAV